MIESVVGIAVISTAAVIVILSKSFDMHKVLGFEIWIDLVFTIIFPLLFANSTFGMMVGVTTGLILSCTLRLMRYCMGCTKIEFRQGSFVWVYYEPN